MTSTFALLVTAALAASSGPADPAAKPNPGTASLSFKAKDAALVGTVYGLDAIDGEARVYGQRASAEILAGRRTVSYTCPDMPLGIDGSPLSFEFAAGRNYVLVCRLGEEAEIRLSDDC